MTRIAIVLAVALISAGCAGRAPLPPKALALNAAGAQALAAGDLETASARLALALEYNPKFVEALVNLGLVELQLGNFARAEQLLDRARRLNPDVAQPHHGLGVLAERRHRPDAAAEHYRGALKVDPGFSPSRANLARVLFEARLYEHAREQYRRLVQVAPGDPVGWVGLAESLLQLGRVEEADAVVAEALEAFADEPELVLLDARRSLRAGRYQEAVRRVAPLTRRRDGIGAAALAWTATGELAAGRARRAVAAAERAVDLEPHEPVAVYALALALHELGDASAPAWLRRARRLLPGHRVVERALAAYDRGAAAPP